MRTRPTLLSLAATAVLATACGSDPAASGADATAPDVISDASDAATRPDFGGGDGVAPDGLVTSEDLGDGVTQTTADASALDQWVYFDLDTGEQVVPTDPAIDTAWDLAIQRYKIKTNGGISGSAGVEGVILDDTPFADVAEAPGDGWFADAADGDDEDTDDDLVFLADGAWYDYDAANHTLAPRPDRVYVVRTAAGDAWKIAVLDYYDDAGSPGEVTFRWASVDAPSDVPADAVTIDASADAFVAVDGTPISGDPATSEAWDFGVVGLGLATNGGTSGPGAGGALLSEATYDELTATDTVGFVVDTDVPLPGPPGSGTFSGSPILSDWYDYDPQTHEVSPADKTFVLRTAEGGYAKLRIHAYDGASWVVRTAAIDRAPAEHTLELSAPSGSDWVYVSLRLGAVVEVADPETDAAWDLAFLGTQLRTNGGTSGAGAGGALLADAAATLGDVSDVPDGGFTADTMVPIPGPPGSGETSGNAVLDGWYDYDPVAHVASPKADTVFLIAAADGTVSKLVIDAYAAGDFTIRWVYAGPNAESF